MIKCRKFKPMAAYTLKRMDPRYLQIAVLSSLLCYGLFTLQFDLTLEKALLTLTVVLGTQFFFTKIFKLPKFDPKSAFISGLSLCLLLRTQSMALLVIAGVITIASKFLLRFKGKHIFNPTNLGIAVLVALTPSVWISPGQWGAAPLFVAFVACAGMLVVQRAARSDVTFAFIAFYAGLLFWRATKLGDPFTIPIHQLSSGAFILFAFFMISDPKTTPDSLPGRILFAFLVAYGAFYGRFTLYSPNALVHSLVLFSALVPLIDFVFKNRRYDWKDRIEPRFLPLEAT